MTRFLFFSFFCLIALSSHAFDLSLVQDSITIESIEITGHKKTKESIILRELTFKIGDIIAIDPFKAAILRSEQNIRNTNLFVLVKVDFEQIRNRIHIIIEVQERLYMMPIPIVYLADRSFNEWWYNHNHDFKRLVYGVQLNHFNLTGNADVLRIKAYGGFVPYFELSYSRPYIDKRQRMGLKGGVFYSKQKSFPYRTWNDILDYVETDDKMIEKKGAYIEYNLRNSFYHFHKLYLGITESSIADTVKILNPQYFGAAGNRITYLTLKYDYKYEETDNRQYPLTGQVFQGNLTYYGGKSVSNLSLGMTYHKFFKIKGDFYGSFNIRSQMSFPKEQLYPLISGFGYKNVLVRGYDLNVVDGQHYALFQTNLKYQIFNKVFDLRKAIKFKYLQSLPVGLYIKTFADVGYIKNYFPAYSNSTLSNNVLIGGGLGLDLVTFYDVIFKINYSINQTGFGKVYFGMQIGI